MKAYRGYLVPLERAMALKLHHLQVSSLLSCCQALAGTVMAIIGPNAAGTVAGLPNLIGACGCRQVLLQSGGPEPATLLFMSACSTDAQHTPCQQEQGSNNSHLRIQLDASVTRLVGPGTPDGQLLQICQQPSPSAGLLLNQSSTLCSLGVAPCLAGINQPCWLALYKQGSMLQIYAIQEQHPQHPQPLQPQQQQQQPAIDSTFNRLLQLLVCITALHPPFTSGATHDRCLV